MSEQEPEPLCTIAIPVYHRMDKGLAFAAVESALTIRRSDVEILVIDDFTTDGTWAQLSRLLDGGRARLLRNERNIGLFHNFNRCLDEARGRYIRILCSDDVLEPGTLDMELAAMERHPDMALLTTRGLRVTSKGEELGLQGVALPEGYYRGDRGIAAVLRANADTGYNSMNYPSGVLIRKSAADRAGRFRSDMRMSGDLEYFLRVMRHGALGVLNRVGCRITVHVHQEGARLSREPLVMEELFQLVHEFQPVLRRYGIDSEVRRALAGLSAWQALRVAMGGAVRLSGGHLTVARRHGAGPREMVDGFSRLLVHRARWALRGPSPPGDVRPDAVL